MQNRLTFYKSSTIRANCYPWKDMGRSVPAPDGWAWSVLHIEACYAPLTASTAKASTEPGSLRMVGSEPGRKHNDKCEIWGGKLRSAASVMQIAWNQSHVTKVSSRQTWRVSHLTNQIAEMDLASMLLTSILPPRGVFISLLSSGLSRQTKNQNMA